MKSILRKSTTPHGIIIAAVCLLTLVFGIAVASRAQAASPQLSAGERLITIHDRGENRGILTHDTTLRQAFKDANIRIDPNDMVEPGLDDQLTATNYDVNIYRARPVTIVDGAIRKKVMSPYQTANQIAEQAKITLHDEDTTTITANTDMVSQGAGLQMVITRATPFKLVLYGTDTVAYTQAKTVGDMLSEKHITLGEKDTLSVAKSAKIVAGMKVEIWHEGKQTVTKKEEIAFPVRQIEDTDKPVGYRKVTTPGVAGEKTVTYEITMKNGKEVKRKKIQSVVIKRAKEQVEVVGAKIAGPAEIIASITKWANHYGVSAATLTRVAKCESSFNPRASNGRYQGLFQQDVATWDVRAARYGVGGASIYDYDAQAKVAAGMWSDGGSGAWECQ